MYLFRKKKSYEQLKEKCEESSSQRRNNSTMRNLVEIALE